MPEFYMKIAQKICFPNLRGGGHVPPPVPVSYAYGSRKGYRVERRCFFTARCILVYRCANVKRFCGHARCVVR